MFYRQCISIILLFIGKAKEIIKDFVTRYYNYIIGILIITLLCWGSYRYGYSKGSEVTDAELANTITRLTDAINLSEQRISALQATNRELEETNNELSRSLKATADIIRETEGSVDRAAKYTNEANRGIESVIREMQQYTKTK